MPARLSTPIFIERSIKVQDGKYTYPNTVYVNSYTKVCITCPIHGDFWQTPELHLRGHGCKNCGNEKPLKKTTEHLTELLKAKNPNITVISERVGFKIPVKCNKCNHGWEVATPYITNKNSKIDCLNCLNRVPLTNEIVDERLKSENRHLQIKRLGDCKNSRTKIKWECLRCEFEWLNTPTLTLKPFSIGCPVCEGQAKLTNEIVDKKLEMKFRETGILFERVGDVAGSMKSIEWRHVDDKCGKTWKSTPNSLFYRFRCPHHDISIGEDKISKFLYRIQKESPDFSFLYNDNSFLICRNPKTDRKLEFDFIVLWKGETKFIIEFDGMQHFQVCRGFKGYKFSKEEAIKKFEDTKYRDSVKDDFCKENNIKLVRISYKQMKKIEEILTKHMDFLK